MNIKAILAKLAADGWEALSAEERAAISPDAIQRSIDDAAAAARRKAEDRLTAAEQATLAERTRADEAAEALRVKAEEKLPEIERLKGEVERLKAQLAERNKAVEGLSANLAGMTREQKLSAVIARSGIAFIPDVDADLLTSALKAKFGAIATPDLDVASVTDGVLASFRDANKALIADRSGHGSGGSPGDRLRFGGREIKNPWKRGADYNLTLQAAVAKQDPALAARLKAEAA